MIQDRTKRAALARRRGSGSAGQAARVKAALAQNVRVKAVETHLGAALPRIGVAAGPR